uniref:SH3 domain-containing protein n=1 Tax=Poecilia mexicana TaxID=48701 RepID=A0A3B3XXR0_9TELE
MADLPIAPGEIYIEVEYDYEYKSKDRVITIREGECYMLMKKANEDWWQVRKDETTKPFYVPAQYVREVRKALMPPPKPLSHSHSALNEKIAESDNFHHSNTNNNNTNTLLRYKMTLCIWITHNSAPLMVLRTNLRQRNPKEVGKCCKPEPQCQWNRVEACVFVRRLGRTPFFKPLQLLLTRCSSGELRVGCAEVAKLLSAGWSKHREPLCQQAVASGLSLFNPRAVVSN